MDRPVYFDTSVFLEIGAKKSKYAKHGRRMKMIDYSAFPLSKPAKVTLTMAERKGKLDKLCASQTGFCAICRQRMTRTPDCFNTATLDNRIPEPMGCAKNDSDTNLQAVCFRCNFLKGSKHERRQYAH